MSTTAAALKSRKRANARVFAATLVGTTVEWYDVIIYAQTASLVFATLFFEPAGQELAVLITFGSIGVTFLFRPLGAILASQFGDRIGRKPMMVVTLILMGAATTLIGVLPTYQAIGVGAPILLILLRILQGIAVGGEWGAAALMAVEYARPTRRGLFGAAPQLGVPLGLLTATGVIALMTGVVSPGAAYLEWGWRVPFLLSIVLLVVGFIVRRSVEETPVFTQLAQRAAQVKIPIATLLRRNWHVVIIAALLFAGTNASGQMLSGGFLASFASSPEGSVRMDPTVVLLAIVAGSIAMLVGTLAAGMWSDRIGRRRMYLIGYAWLILAVFPLFWLTGTAEIGPLFLGTILFGLGLGLSYGAQPAWYAEAFPANVRFAGVSVAYTLGNILGGAFAPLIAAALVQSTGTVNSVGLYLVGINLLGVVAALLLRDRTRIALGIEALREQEVGITVFDRRAPSRATTVE